MKVKDTFPYCSAKVPMLVTEGVGKVLFDGDRNEMPEELEELTAARFEFLFNERKFWVAVEAQKSKEEKQSPAEAEDVRCADCAWYAKEKGRCWKGVKQECNDDTVCPLGMKRSDYE